MPRRISLLIGTCMIGSVVIAASDAPQYFAVVFVAGKILADLWSYGTEGP